MGGLDAIRGHLTDGGCDEAPSAEHLPIVLQGDAGHGPLAEFVEHRSRRHLEIAASADTAKAARSFVEKRGTRSTTP